ncbi:hypothetical protein HWI79_2734 [Cryptosporidium felis]|nr:hypothetical protein HWI79_2734 [Cryptosporidium felis]
MEDIGALHTGVDDGGAGLLVAFLSSHDLTAPFNPGNVKLSGDVEDSEPVLTGVLAADKECKPVGNVEYEDAAALCKLVYVYGLQDALGNVHSSRGLEPVVADRMFFSLQQFQELRFLDTLLSDGQA